MRARWISERPHIELPMVGQAIVASWWPGRYYLVFTLQLDSASPMRRLTELIRTGEAYDQVTAAPEVFFTGVFKCDKYGLMSGDLLYEREYRTLSEANSGHREVLVLLADGSLKMSPIRSELALLTSSRKGIDASGDTD